MELLLLIHYKNLKRWFIWKKIIELDIKNLEINKQSKYERGINSTLQLHNSIKEQEHIKKQTSLLNNEIESNIEVLVKRLQNIRQ